MIRALVGLAIAAVISGCSGAATAPRSATTTPFAAATAVQTAPASTSAVASPSAVTAAWRRIADIPTPRSEVAAAVSHGNGVFVIGGQGGPQRVERYDATAERWDRAPDLPVGVDHAMAAAAEGLQSSAPQGVFVFGGYLANGSATARSFRFDGAATRWEEIAPMPAPRAAGAAVELGGSIFIVGGADGSRLIAPTYEDNVFTREWRTVAAIPTPRDHLAGAAIGGKICAVGGRQLSMSLNLAAFECYDPRADSWARLPDAPTARGGIGAAAYGGRIYVVGGEQPSGTYREVEIFDQRANAWTRGPDLPTPRHGVGVVVVDPTKAIVGSDLVYTPARLLVLGGGPMPGGSQIAVCESLDLR